MGKNLDRLLQLFMLSEEKSFILDFDKDIEVHLQNLEDYEKKTGKKIHLLLFQKQIDLVWNYFKIKYNDTQKFESLYISKEDRKDMEFFIKRNKVFDKLRKGINELPWDYFQFSPWEDLIVDDIYYTFKSYCNRITIWAVDFTNPMGTHYIGRSDEIKRETYQCYVYGMEDVLNSYRAIGNFLTPSDPYKKLGLPHNFEFSELMNDNTSHLHRFPTYYRLQKDSMTGEQSVKKFIGYPKDLNHFRGE